MDGKVELQIPEEELHWTFARSGGPGGQNVNKVASKAVLHWDFAKSNALPDDAKQRLAARQRNLHGDPGIDDQAHRSVAAARTADGRDDVRHWRAPAGHRPRRLVPRATNPGDAA